MKTLDEITRLSAEDLDRIASDERIPVPEDLEVRLPGRYPEHAWRIAAAVALLIGVGYREPKDTFDDPYLAYAAVEKVLGKMSGTLQHGAAKVAESEAVIDKINYWK